ncbi:hypothetical protein AAFF_G00125080 [Aldrovandia affinis]|uniref:Uncharacterized protein n=1 Tax=Aldrovandia affinis TaxID=143900 RepID=A0AAD7W9K4_9TELE|nr:hypothetical protein AAFF_G00125080 [Aldrovandia affinis]
MGSHTSGSLAWALSYRTVSPPCDGKAREKRSRSADPLLQGLSVPEQTAQRKTRADCTIDLLTTQQPQRAQTR